MMIARAGGLDQGNIIQNLLDVESWGDVQNYLFLAGSAINGIKNDQGRYDPVIGARAMEEAVSIYHDKVFSNGADVHVENIKNVAREKGYASLLLALDQRYAKNH